METTKLIITPKTKVMDVIENYPQLEAALINYAAAIVTGKQIGRAHF